MIYQTLDTGWYISLIYALGFLLVLEMFIKLQLQNVLSYNKLNQASKIAPKSKSLDKKQYPLNYLQL